MASQLHSGEPGSENSTSNSEITQLYRELLGKTSDYLRTEFEGTAEDYRLIQELNIVTQRKYADLQESAESAMETFRTTHERYELLKPVLEEIDSMETKINELERTMFRLDTYAKQLDIRFKALERK